jgi:hypothetical protein
LLEIQNLDPYPHTFQNNLNFNKISQERSSELTGLIFLPLTIFHPIKWYFKHES